MIDIEAAQIENHFVGPVLKEARKEKTSVIELYRDRESIVLRSFGEKIGKVKVDVSADGHPLRERLYRLAEGQNLIITDFEHVINAEHPDGIVYWGAWGFYKYSAQR